MAALVASNVLMIFPLDLGSGEAVLGTIRTAVTERGAGQSIGGA